MSRQILFNNANAVPAGGGVDSVALEDIAEARVYGFDADNFGDESLNLDAAAPAGVKRVVFAQGVRTGESTIFTSQINIEDVEDVTRTNYVAPVPQVTTVTAEEAEGFATVKVIEASAGFKPHRRVTATIKATGLTAAQIATALAEQLNAQSPRFFTATTSTADLIITGDAGVSFETALDDEAQDWTVVATTTPNFGTGTYDHVKILEETAWGQQGNFLNRTYLPVSPPSYAVPGGAYDLITVRVRTNTTPNISIGNQFQEITFAVLATGTGIDLATFFGV